MRRVFVIGFTILLVAMLALPGFALSDGSKMLHTDLEFDYIETMYNGEVLGRAPWPFRDLTDTDTDEAFTYTSTQSHFYGGHSVVLDDGLYTLEGRFRGYMQSVRLHASNLFLEPAKIIGENFTLVGEADGYDIMLMNPFFEGRVAYVAADSDGVYQLYYEDFYFHMDYSSSEIPLGVEFMNGLRNTLEHWSDDVARIYVPELTVGFTLSEVLLDGGGQVTPQFHVYADNLTSSERWTDVHTWFEQYVFYDTEVITETVYVENEFEVGTFLANSVTSFLNTELFPGFSIDNIFYLVMVIVVLLAFVKLLS